MPLRAFRVARSELQYTVRQRRESITNLELDKGRTATKAEVECDVNERVWPSSNLQEQSAGEIA